MTIRNKTVEYSFNFITSSIAAGTSGSHEPLVIHIPETGSHRTFRSVVVQTYFQQSPAAAVSPSAMGTSIQFTGPSRSPISTGITSSTLANTGEAMTFMCQRDVTGFFQSNFSSSFNYVTCSVHATLTQATQPYTNIASKIIITYSYEELSSSIQLKTVRIPLEGRTGNLSTTLTAVDHIPALATYLPEANKTFRDIFFEIEAQNNTTAAAAPNPQLNLSLDAEAAWGDGAPDDALASALYYYRIFKRPDMNVSSSHVLSASTTNTNTPFPCLTAVLYATYEYDASQTTSVFNSLMIPIFDEAGCVGGNTPFLQTRFKRSIPIVDEGPIKIMSSSAKIWLSDGAAVTANFAFNSQSYVGYTWAASLRGGNLVFQRRIDDALTSSFSRGLNDFTFGVYRSSNALGSIGSNLSGMLYLNYTSSVNPEGIGSNSKTVLTHHKGFENNTTSEVIIWSGSYNQPYIPEDYYYLISGGGLFYPTVVSTFLASQWTTWQVQLRPEEGSGWEEIYVGTILADGEAGIQPFAAFASDIWKRYPDDPDPNHLLYNIDRNYRFNNGPGAGHRINGSHITTYHSRMFEKTGSIFPNPGAGHSVRVYRNDTNDLVLTASTNADGQYFVRYHNDTVDLYSEIKVSDTQMGRSGLFRVSSSFQPSPFDPLSIPQISLSLTDNYVSSLWTDDTPNSYNLTQSVGAQVPDVGTLAGKTAPDFNGTTDYLETDTASFGDVVGTTQFEIWAVYNVDSVTSDGAAYYQKAALAGDGADGWVTLGLSSTAVQFGYNNGAIDYVATDTVSTLGTGPHVVRAWIDSSNLVNLRVDDRATVDAGSTFVGFRTFTTAEFRTGTNFDGTNHINGACHIWVFDGNLSSQDVADFYAYLNAEYGVTVP